MKSDAGLPSPPPNAQQHTEKETYHQKPGCVGFRLLKVYATISDHAWAKTIDNIYMWAEKSYVNSRHVNKKRHENTELTTNYGDCVC